METKVCICCNKELPITSFKLDRYGNYVKICNSCINHKRISNKDKKRNELLEQALSKFNNRELLLELKRRNFKGTLKLVVEKIIKEEKTINLNEYN